MVAPTADTPYIVKGHYDARQQRQEAASVITPGPLPTRGPFSGVAPATPAVAGRPLGATASAAVPVSAFAQAAASANPAATVAVGPGQILLGPDALRQLNAQSNTTQPAPARVAGTSEPRLAAASTDPGRVAPASLVLVQAIADDGDGAVQRLGASPSFGVRQYAEAASIAEPAGALAVNRPVVASTPGVDGQGLVRSDADRAVSFGDANGVVDGTSAGAVDVAARRTAALAAYGRGAQAAA